MTDQARVIVIGGGIVGCAVLYHLAKMGWRDVLLLERMELTSGSSWHAAGSLFSLTAPSAAAVLQRYTRELYPVIEKESGQSVGYHRSGGLSIARSEEERTRQKMLQDRCQRNGIPSEFLSMEEVRRRLPIIDTDGLLSALWEPEKGFVDPASATQAFAIAARKLGASIRRHAPVTATRQLRSGEWEVDTPSGAIRAEFVVNAAGLWAREVAAQAGIRLPLMPVEHHYLVTEAIPEVAAFEGELPTVSDAQWNWYCRREGQGLLLGAYESRCVHWAEHGTPPDFGHELLPDDLSRMEENFAHAVDVLPCLGKAGVKRVVNGPMIFSPDLNPLLGPYPGKRGYFCVAGVMTGFNQGGGIGRTLAEWIVEGEPSLDVAAWDVARYGDWTGRAYTKARTAYFYEHRSHRTYPGQQFEAGRPVRKSPVHGRLAARGAVHGESFGLEVPLWFARAGDGREDRYSYARQNWFDAVCEEGRAVRDSVGLFEISAFSKFLVQGRGSAEWLDRLLANALPAVGRTALTPMLSPKGRLLGDFTTSRLAEDRFLLVGSGAMQKVHERWFDLNGPVAGVEIQNLSASMSGFHIAGPRARAVLERLAATDVSNGAFPFLSARTLDLDGCPETTAIRVSFTGELGYELHFPNGYAEPLLDRLMAAGEDFGLRLAGMRALMWLRLEKSFPSWGLELSSDYSPIEPGLDRYVKPGKGDFVGRDAFVRASKHGPRERLVTLVVDADGADCWGGESIYRDGEHVGYVTSGGFGPCVGESLALGYLRAPAVEEGAEVEVLVMGERRPARLTLTPRYDAAGARMRS